MPTDLEIKHGNMAQHFAPTLVLKKEEYYPYTTIMTLNKLDCHRTQLVLAIPLQHSFSTVPFDKLTFLKKRGINLEKDIGKDIIIFIGGEWKEFNPLGAANFLRPNANNSLDTINQITTTEFKAFIRWAKDEDFISGSFDRASIRSKFPAISLQAIFGVKDLIGSEYNYQKIELNLEHRTQIGILGRIEYGANIGAVFGNVAYPLLHAIPGNQSLWLMTSAFNKLNFLEFICDRYTGFYLENHWDGFFMNKIL